MKINKKIQQLSDLEIIVKATKDLTKVVVICREPENAKMSEMVENFLALYNFNCITIDGRKHCIWIDSHPNSLTAFMNMGFFDEHADRIDYHKISKVFAEHGVELPFIIPREGEEKE